MIRLSTLLAAGLVFGAGASQTLAQAVTFSVIGSGITADAMSDDGQFIAGGGLDGFLWTEAGGLQTGFGTDFRPKGVNFDGSVLVGDGDNAGATEPALWELVGGYAVLGNQGGATGCGFSVGSLDDVSSDGTIAVGTSWQGCKTSPMRWTDGVGLTLMSKQDASSSARALCISGDGLVAGGWDRGLSTGSGSTNRACLWLDDVTQTFPTVTATNPEGYGAIMAMNSDGSVFAGSTREFGTTVPFRSTPGNPFEILPPLPGVPGGGYEVTGISEDGSVVIGYRFEGTSVVPVLWLPGEDPVTIVDLLAANGISVDTFTTMRAATAISADGTKICGWGFSESWLLELDFVWEDLGNGLAGSFGEPVLTGTGDLTPGSPFSIDLTNALGNAGVFVVLGASTLYAPIKGGVLVPSPDFIIAGFSTNPAGELSIATGWPLGIPAGFVTTIQEWVQDPAGPKNVSASNGLGATAH